VKDSIDVALQHFSDTQQHNRYSSVLKASKKALLPHGKIRKALSFTSMTFRECDIILAALRRETL